jgi:beta-lactamase regulating signal transducer with metallopeptidase domain
MYTLIVQALNDAGDSWAGWAWPMLWQSALVAGIIFLIDRLIRNRARATVRYALWMLVLVKLVLPPDLAFPSGPGYWMQWHTAVTEATVPAGSSTAAVSYTVPSQLADEQASGPAATMTIEKAMPVASAGAGRIHLEWAGLAYIVWVCGVTALSVHTVRRMLFVRKLVQAAEPASERMQEEVNSLAARMGLRGRVELKVTGEPISAAVCGIVRPVVLVPGAVLRQMSQEKLRGILMHELAHVRRGDLAVNVLQTILTIVYFYNPVVWAVSAVIRCIREHSVDEMVLVGLDEQAHNYGDTLLEVAEMALAKRITSIGLLGVVESKKMLAERIRHIAARGIPCRGDCGVRGLMLVVLLGAVLLPMACASEKEPGFTVKGRVTDAVSGKPIAGAKVSDGKYNGGKFGSVTDKDGYYSYKTWYEEHNIDCNAPGYKTQKKLVETKAFGKEKEKTIDFALSAGKRSSRRSTGTSNTVIVATGKPAWTAVRPNDVPNPATGISKGPSWVVESVADGNNSHLRMYRRGTGAAGPMELQAASLEMQADQMRLQAEGLHLQAEELATRPEYLQGITDEQKAQLKSLDEQRNDLLKQARELAKMGTGYKATMPDANGIERTRELLAQTKVNDEAVRHQMEDMRKQLADLESQAGVRAKGIGQSSTQEFARASSEVGRHVDEYYQSRTDVVSRETLGWQITSEPNGPRTVEYKCRVKTRDGRSSREADIFTFDKDGKVKSVKTKSEQEPLEPAKP